MTPRILVQDQIAAGRLAAPLGFVPGPYKLVLWIAAHLRLRPDLRALVAWLKSNIQETPDTDLPERTGQPTGRQVLQRSPDDGPRPQRQA